MSKRKPRQRLRKHHLKRFASNVINTGRSVDHAKMSEFYTRRDWDEERLAEAIGLKKVASEYRVNIIMKVKELLDLRAHETVMFYNFGHIRLCFNARKTKWFFVDKDEVRGLFAQSIVYGTYAGAMLAMRRSRISWEVKHSFTNTA